jgi:TRAP-type C4-dicarboxylate transport system permease large subunit
MIRFALVLGIAFIIFALAAEATTLWLVVAGSVIAVLFVISAMVLAYGWAQKQFQDDVEF